VGKHSYSQKYTKQVERYRLTRSGLMDRFMGRRRVCLNQGLNETQAWRQAFDSMEEEINEWEDSNATTIAEEESPESPNHKVAMMAKRLKKSEIAATLEDGSIEGKPLTKQDFQWALANHMRDGVSFEDAPSSAAWNLRNRLDEKDIYKFALQQAQAAEDYSEQEQAALIKSGLADSLREEFDTLWEKVREVLEPELPAVL